ncbi:MAG: hypothetical protein AAF702_44005 [Chloroflexota bacterium]
MKNRNSITKNQLSRHRTANENIRVRAQFLGTLAVVALVILAPFIGALIYVHIYAGVNTVMWVLSIVGVLIMCLLFTFIVDRFQERSIRFTSSSIANLATGVNTAIAQNARTQGEMDRASIRVMTNQQLHEQRVDATKQITDYRQQNSGPLFEFDDEEGDDDYFTIGTFREIT